MINVELMDLPTTIRGFVTKSVDDYTIVINSKMSAEMQKQTYRHELRHIERGDLDGSGDIDRIEMEMQNVDRENLDGEIQV